MGNMGYIFKLYFPIFCLVSLSSASHFRGSTISWTRADASSLTVDFKVITHWYTGGISPRNADFRLVFGDGSPSFTPTSADFALDSVDGSGTIRTIIYYVTHTYPAATQYTASIASCCRQSAVVNAGD